MSIYDCLTCIIVHLGYIDLIHCMHVFSSVIVGGQLWVVYALYPPSRFQHVFSDEPAVCKGFIVRK
jgi:hypothetical protein